MKISIIIIITLMIVLSTIYVCNTHVHIYSIQLLISINYIYRIRYVFMWSHIATGCFWCGRYHMYLCLGEIRMFEWDIIGLPWIVPVDWINICWFYKLNWYIKRETNKHSIFGISDWIISILLKENWTGIRMIRNI